MSKGLFAGKKHGDLVFDCDIHPEIPGTSVLLPYLDSYWTEYVVNSELTDFQTYNYPPKAPISARRNWRCDPIKPAGSLEQVQRELLNEFEIDRAVINSLFGSFMLMNADMGHALTVAANNYFKDQWLDKEDRLRASISIAPQDPANAVGEIERLAGDARFIQVMMMAANDMLLGKRHYWPIYAAAEKANLPIMIHAGTAFRYGVAPGGPTSYFFEGYNAQAGAIANQITSIVAEGVLNKFPNLKFVVAESGITWLPSTIARLNKYWQGMRREIPWLNQRPGDLILERFYFTLQPFDCPDDENTVRIALRHLGDELKIVFSTDYPHWQFDGPNPIPPGFSPELIYKIAVENPKLLYEGRMK